MKSSLLYIPLIYNLLHEADCMKCLRCNGVLNPLLCDRIKICDQTEICMSVQYLTGNKETLYNVGCFPKNLCVNGSIGPPVHNNPNAEAAHLDPDDQILCSYCCQGDTCNHASCGNDGFILSRGPICYDCPQTTDPSICSFVRTCEDGEVCRLHEQTQLGLTFYTTSCSIKSDCQMKDDNIFGRRRRSIERTECCDSDLCNGRTTETSSTMTSTIKTTLPPRRYRDCKDWRLLAVASSGVYDIYPDGKTRITVYCDQVTDGGGWTVVLSRNKTFNGGRLWKDYKRGFGDVHGLYWLGNENIHLLTANKTSAVYFKMMSTDGTWYYATYKNASVGPESDGYRFHADVKSYKGNAGNSIDQQYGRMNGIQFSTIDKDNDFAANNCATDYGGGWWFDSCEFVCFTCLYNFEWRHNVGGLLSSTMMFRRT